MILFSLHQFKTKSNVLLFGRCCLELACPGCTSERWRVAGGFTQWNSKHCGRVGRRWQRAGSESYLLLTILTAYFSPVFLCVQRLQMEKLPSPRALSFRSIS